MVAREKNIIVGMSGGVDSSVAAYLLKQQGHHVSGIFMKNWESDDPDGCTAAEDFADAKAAAQLLDIPLTAVNFSEDYWQRVFQHFLAEYQAGRTPNPDILCNKEIKFKAFLDHARQLGADFIATGHYARIQATESGYALLKGNDPNKDQSYFLCALNQQQLRHSLFPLGELCKTDVRKIAASIGLLNHAKRDSTGICFIGERKFRDFLQQYLLTKPGPIVTTSNQIIGEHHGLMYYTLGQRQGLNIGGLKNATSEPWYVVDKDQVGNRLIVAQGHNHPRLFSNSLICHRIHWIKPPPTLPLACQAKCRYRQADTPCHITRHENHYQVRFAAPQRAVTPGQYIVFYQGDECLGGGVIESRQQPVGPATSTTVSDASS